MYTRFIPDFYTDQDYPEFQALSKEDQAKILKGITDYRTAVSMASAEAKEKFIQPLLETSRMVIYSRTWGK